MLIAIDSESLVARAAGSYPYPVVGAGDDVASVFEIKNVVRLTTATKIVVEFETELDDDELQHLIDQGIVAVSVHVRAASTFQVRHERPDLTGDFGTRRTWRLELSQDDFVGRMSFEVQLLATRGIDGYHLTRQSPDYGTARFSVRAGDVLGVGGRFVIDVDKWYDPLRPPLDSCLKFSSDDTLAKGINVVFDNPDYIDVRIPAAAYESFAMLRAYRKFLIAAAVVPALMHTLVKLEAGEFEGYEDSAWFLALDELIEKLGVEDRDALDQVQAILEDPIISAVVEEAAYIGEDEE